MTLAPDLDGLIPIKRFVSALMNKHKDSMDKSHRFVVEQLTIDAITELNQYITSNDKWEKITVNEDRYIDLPNDFVRFADVGMNDGQGRFWPFTRDDSLLTTFTFKNGSENYDILDVKQGRPSGTHGGYGIYGRRGGRNRYYYAYDKRQNRIFFSDVPKENDGEVILKYSTSGVRISGSVLIPRAAKDVLEKMVRYEFENNKNSTPVSKKRELERDMERAISKFRNSEWTMTQLYDTVASQWTQSINR